jgi:hypothetical protein
MVHYEPSLDRYESIISGHGRACQPQTHESHESSLLAGD